MDETFLMLCPSFPGLSKQQLMDADAHVRESLSPRQLWLVSVRKARARGALQALVVGLAEEDDAQEQDPVDPRPNQESVLARQEQEEHLRLALASLSAPERLLIRLRFEEGLSLEQIAGLTGLGDAQRVHRHIADVLGTLRKRVT